VEFLEQLLSFGVEFAMLLVVVLVVVVREAWLLVWGVMVREVVEVVSEGEEAVDVVVRMQGASFRWWRRSRGLRLWSSRLDGWSRGRRGCGGFGRQGRKGREEEMWMAWLV
jgi:hypothetical protein